MNTKSIQDRMLAVGDDQDDDVVDIDEERLCPRCGTDNDPESERCHSCNCRMVLPTLAECGKRLPIGIPNFDSKTLEKRFDMIPLTWPIERAINRSWQKSRESLSISEYLGTVLAYTVISIGDVDMSKLKFHDRMLKFEYMFSADVFYMYAYLRILSMGNELRLNSLNCVDVSCGHRFNYTADVSSLSILGIDSIAELEKTITLKDGFMYGGSVRDTLIIQPQKWESLKVGGSRITEAEIFERAAISSIVEIVGLSRGAMLTDSDFEKLSKSDIDIIKMALEDFVAGPRWVVEGNCPKCNEQFFFEIDWFYQNFFASSYTSRRRKKRQTK